MVDTSTMPNIGGLSCPTMPPDTSHSCYMGDELYVTVNTPHGVVMRDDGWVEYTLDDIYKAKIRCLLKKLSRGY